MFRVNNEKVEIDNDSIQLDLTWERAAEICNGLGRALSDMIRHAIGPYEPIFKQEDLDRDSKRMRRVLRRIDDIEYASPHVTSTMDELQ